MDGADVLWHDISISQNRNQVIMQNYLLGGVDFCSLARLTCDERSKAIAMALVLGLA